MKARLYEVALGAGRFTALTAALAAGIAVVSLAFGALLGASATRSLSVGLYLGGSLFLVIGFFHGVKGPVRTRGTGPTQGPEPVLLGERRRFRWATPEEREESISTSALFVILGLVLIVLGAIADTRYRLV